MKVFHIPADQQKPTAVIDIDDSNGIVPALRTLLDCRLIEIIYPQSGSALHSVGRYVMIGDEEGRYVHAPVNNWRATVLAGFPYALAGDIAVVSDLLPAPDDDDFDDGDDEGETVGPVPDDFHDQLLKATRL